MKYFSLFIYMRVGACVWRAILISNWQSAIRQPSVPHLLPPFSHLPRPCQKCETNPRL